MDTRVKAQKGDPATPKGVAARDIASTRDLVAPFVANKKVLVSVPSGRTAEAIKPDVLAFANTIIAKLP
jgi:hypothetical protein